MLIREFFSDLKLSPIPSIMAIIITAIGLLSSFLVLLLYITDNRIDKYHDDYQNIYRVETQFNLPNGDEVKSARAPLPLISALQNDKDIKRVDYVLRLFLNLQVKNRTYSDVEIYAVSDGFFSTLNPYQLHPPKLSMNEIIITPEFNQQYLKFDNPKGHTITLGDKGTFVIKEVMSLNKASRFKTGAVIAFSPDLLDGYHEKRHDWYDTHAYTFITLLAQATPSIEQLKSLVIRYAPQLPGAPFSPQEFIKLSARNIADIHYDDELPDEMSMVISKSYIYALYAAGIFVFFTTIMNFFNINSVIYTNKKNSFQIKKSMGASQTQLLAESFYIATIQTIFVLLVGVITLLYLIHSSDTIKTLILEQENKVRLITFFSTFIAVYVTILLSHIIYLCVVIFPNRSSHNKTYNEQPLSRHLHQGTLCLQIIIAGVIIYLWADVITQNSFMQQHDFGYEKENIITFQLSDELKRPESINNLQDKLKHTIKTSPLTLSSWRPFDMSKSVTSISHSHQQEEDNLLTINTFNANREFINTWGLKVLAGHDNTIKASKNKNIHHAIATKSFMNSMKKTSYDEILNNVFYISDGDSKREVRILKVVNDFHLASSNGNSPPILIFIRDDIQRYGILKLQDKQDINIAKKILESYSINSEQIKTVKEIHKEYLRNNKSIQNVINIVTLISVTIILISTMIIGASEYKRFEKTFKIMDFIGGSFFTHIIFFIQQNITPIAIAAIISYPIGILLLTKWLHQYSIVTHLSYAYATGAFLTFIVSILIVMTAVLISSKKH